MKNINSKPAIQLRIARITDIPAIQLIAREAFPATYASILSMEQIHYMLTKMYTPQALKQQIAEAIVFTLALQNNTPVGFNALEKKTSSFFCLKRLYLLPKFQKIGAGKILLMKAIDDMNKQGGTTMQLQVNRYNTTAVEFYKRHNFIVIETLDSDIGEGYVMNDYIMQYKTPVVTN